jgi:hypothetical protein
VPILKRRSRIVSFRLSDDEYDSLKSVSTTRGARSVSEFTRAVACNANEPEKIETTLRSLDERMALLDRRLQILTDVLQSKKAMGITEYTETEDKEPVE